MLGQFLSKKNVLFFLMSQNFARNIDKDPYELSLTSEPEWGGRGGGSERTDVPLKRRRKKLA